MLGVTIQTWTAWAVLFFIFLEFTIMFTTFNSILNISIEVAAFLPLLMFMHYTVITTMNNSKSVALEESTQTPEPSLKELFLEADRIGNKYLEPNEIAAYNEALAQEVDAISEMEGTMQPTTEDDYREALEEIREDLGYQLQAMPEYTMTLALSDNKTEDRLESKTRTQLVQMLKDKGIKGYSKWNKAKMIEALS